MTLFVQREPRASPKAIVAVAENRLIQLLGRADRGKLLDRCEPVELVLSQTLTVAGDVTRHAYFPLDAFISLLTIEAGQPALEVGMIGNEGMLGVQLALDVTAVPLHALVQGAGSAWRMDARGFRIALRESAALRRVMNRYVYVLMTQMASSAACLRYHPLVPRLARWLLMSQDRAHADHFHITHDFLASMLGMRRAGITIAAGELQSSGLIEYHRGALVVLDRKGLEAVSCSCYAADRLAYQRQLG